MDAKRVRPSIHKFRVGRTCYQEYGYHLKNLKKDFLFIMKLIAMQKKIKK